MKFGLVLILGIVAVVGYFLYKRQKSRKEFEKFARENPNWQRDLENMTQGESEDMPVDQSGNGWVDLGLPSGLLWDSCNLGASAPEEYGCYYTWGETQPVDEHGDFKNRYYDGNVGLWLTKYCSKPEMGLDGFSDKLEVLEPCDDAATADLEGARMPTIDNWIELISNTTGEFTTLGGVRGYRFTAANGNSIFLPAAGQPMQDSLYESVHNQYSKMSEMEESNLSNDMKRITESISEYMEKSMPSSGLMGDYWSSTLDMENPMNAWCFAFNTETQNAKPIGQLRLAAQSIRAVRPVQR